MARKQTSTPKSDFGSEPDLATLIWSALSDLLFSPRTPAQAPRRGATSTIPKSPNIARELGETGPAPEIPLADRMSEYFAESFPTGMPRELPVEPDFDLTLGPPMPERGRRAAAPEAPPLPERRPPMDPAVAEDMMRSLLGLPSRNPLFHTQPEEAGALPSFGTLQSFAEQLAMMPQQEAPLPTTEFNLPIERVRARRIR